MNPPGRLQAAVAEALLELTQTLWEMQYAQRRNAQPLTARDFLTLSALREASLHVGDIGRLLGCCRHGMSKAIRRARRAAVTGRPRTGRRRSSRSRAGSGRGTRRR